MSSAAARTGNMRSFSDTCYYEGASFGSVLLNGTGWLNGDGVTVYSNGSTCTVTGTYYHLPGTGVETGMEWQCVELVNRLYLTRGWIGSTWSGNGNQMYYTAPANLSKQPQGSISHLSPGDVVSYAGGTAGHVAIVNTVTPNGSGGYTIGLVNQNIAGGPYTTTTLSGGYLTAPWNGYAVIGVIHAPVAAQMARVVPATLYNPATGLEETYYRGGNGNLWETYFSSTGQHNQDLKVAMTGDPATLYNPATGLEETYYRGGNGNLWETYFSSTGQHNQDLTAAMSAS
jgi:CHAP domain